VNETIRLWKDPVFRTTFDGAQRDPMAGSPVGPVGGPDGDLNLVFGAGPYPWSVLPCWSLPLMASCRTCWNTEC
jgi:hypothetical protein